MAKTKRHRTRPRATSPPVVTPGMTHVLAPPLHEDVDEAKWIRRKELGTKGVSEEDRAKLKTALEQDLASRPQSERKQESNITFVEKQLEALGLTRSWSWRRDLVREVERALRRKEADRSS
jgi:hypothetical protein